MIIVKLIFRLPGAPLDLYTYLAVHSQHIAESVESAMSSIVLATSPPLFPPVPPPLHWSPLFWTDSDTGLSVWFSHCITLQNAFCWHCSLAPQPLSWLEHSPNSRYQKFLGLISPKTTNKTLGNFVTSNQGPPFQDKCMKDFPGKHIVGFLSSGGSDDRLGSGPGSPGLPRRPLSWPGSLPDPRRIPAQAK